MTTSLKIVVCGGGIAGLAAAVGLVRKGHHVLVLESHGTLSEVGGGISVQANATRVLKSFGILDRFEESAAPLSGFVFRRYADSAVLSTAPDINRNPEGLPLWGMGRVDYQNGFYHAAVELGVEVRFGARVVDIDEDTPCVFLAGGEKINADVIVGADGIKSRVRTCIIPNEDVTPAVLPYSVFRASISTAELAADPVTAPLVQESRLQCWVGYRRYIIAFPLEGGRSLLVDGMHPTPSQNEVGTWSRAADLPGLQRVFADFDAPVRRLLDHVQSCADWALAETPPLPRWVSRSGRVVLMGDAAHAMLPHLGQGAAMATEDAGALAECLGRVGARGPAAVPAALRVYERTRKWRAERVVMKTRREGDLMALADGEGQEWRDARLAGRAVPPEADVELPVANPEFNAWLNNYNIFTETNQALDKAGL